MKLKHETVRSSVLVPGDLVLLYVLDLSITRNLKERPSSSMLVATLSNYVNASPDDLHTGVVVSVAPYPGSSSKSRGIIVTALVDDRLRHQSVGRPQSTFSIRITE